ncbi:carbohydrate kinase family protein [Deinococcus ruber]|uniref:Carbohydrate kinase n=1 Tax=Deinococcus ruber TaxID=1848197 RepID=A0A918C4D0_9DEIO|nr:carbohydrate kinase family protein [Deinococcus ruber]GGR05277.1 carbohydrate kinase [Deinococcus ruber]
MTEKTAPVLVVGGINADVLGRTLSAPVLHTSNPAHASVTPGGVARNIAETLARLGVAARLLGAVGTDVLGTGVLDATERAGVDVSGVLHLRGQTGTYLAVLNDAGELHIGLAAMELTDTLTPEVAAGWAAEVAGALLLILDANLPAQTVRMLLDAAQTAGVRTVLDPVSAPKAARLRGLLDGVFLLTPDRAELEALGGLEEVYRQGVQQVLLTLGAQGSVLHRPGQTPIATPAPAVSVRDVTGAGDALVSGLCAGLVRGLPLPDAVQVGHACAALTVQSAHTVRNDLSWEAVTHFQTTVQHGQPQETTTL